MTTTASPVDPAHTGPETELPHWRPARVAWFDTEKGFGFLTPVTGPPVFVDYSVIEIPGYKTLIAGQPVIYTATDTGRGPEATRVIPYPHITADRDPGRRRQSRRGAATRRPRCLTRAA
ncbi:cold-shock protein [Nocardia aurantiaca]|uniref:CSD domain-containing protein n=1 Tax=Nocardia aurantiaca TaxID=2675850 RepID=A0A6I3KZS1_9NOCA|nr:cold shock domain-containing protein [Nocardia aurantiaca]MTE13764.1 hypothetical protein [Nocardia aurantiaca]